MDRRLGVALLFVVPLLAGCFDFTGTKNPHEPGAELGLFHVTAEETANSCGQGALGSQPSWEFDVRLSVDRSSIFWDNGTEIISGTLEDDGTSFRFDTAVEMNMRAEEEVWLPPCSIRRRDRADGILDGAEDAASFEGELRYDFTPTSGSDCQDLVDGNAPIFAALPCDFGYRIEGERQ